MRCKHPRPTVHEEQNAESVFWFEDGKIANDVSREHGPTGAYFVHCPDCGYSRRFPSGKTRPLWVGRLIDLIGAAAP